MHNLGNVYICGSPFVMSRTDAQNGLYNIFKESILSYLGDFNLSFNIIYLKHNKT